MTSPSQPIGELIAELKTPLTYTYPLLSFTERANVERAKAAAALASLAEQNERILGLLARAQTILANMALENEGAIFNRWPINHEPLRADAKNLLPEIMKVAPLHMHLSRASEKEST